MLYSLVYYELRYGEMKLFTPPKNDFALPHTPFCCLGIATPFLKHPTTTWKSNSHHRFVTIAHLHHRWLVWKRLVLSKYSANNVDHQNNQFCTSCRTLFISTNLTIRQYPMFLMLLYPPCCKWILSDSYRCSQKSTDTTDSLTTPWQKKEDSE